MKLYEVTDGGIKFTSQRKVGEVRIPNYVYDLWLPLIGAEGMGAYGLYCRLEMGGAVKKVTLRDLAKTLRIGIEKLNKINETLEECEFVRIGKPMGEARLMHWTTCIEILDPPKEVSVELIEKYQHPQGYEVLTYWLIDNPVPPEAPNPISGDTKSNLDKAPNPISNIESLDIESLDVLPKSDKSDLPQPKKPPKAPKKEKVPISPAVLVHQQVTEYYQITSHWRDEITSAVGDTQDSLKRWKETLIAWTGRSFFGGNVQGQLAWFKDGIPKYTGKEETLNFTIRNGRNTLIIP